MSSTGPTTKPWLQHDKPAFIKTIQANENAAQMNKEEDVYERFSEVTKYLNDKVKPTQIFRSSAPNYVYIDHPDIDNDLSQNFHKPKEALPFLIEHKIDAILSFNFHSYEEEDIKTLKGKNIAYLHMPVGDFKPFDKEKFNAVLAYIKGKKRVLIHCGYGAGRTGTAVTGIQLYCTDGKEPPDAEWGEVDGGNQVETKAQIQSLNEWRDIMTGKTK